jgi:hypothetical protein
MKHWFRRIKHAFSFRRNKNSKPIDFQEATEDDYAPWWGSFSVAEEQSRYAKIGNVVLCIDHFNEQWNIASYRDEKKQQSKTIAAHIMQGEIVLKPALPNRALLFKLERPLFLPAKSNMNLYTSTPVFIRVEIGTPPIPLEEIPSEILCETWFGDTTLDGEICFAASTFASPRLEELARDVTHVITPIAVVNHSNENVLLKQVQIPCPTLSVFNDSQNRLWTEQLNLNFEHDGEEDTLIINGPPNGSKDFSKLSFPRIYIRSGFKRFFR